MSAETDAWKLRQIREAGEAFDAIRYTDMPFADIVDKAFWTLGYISGRADMADSEAQRQMDEPPT